MAAHFIFEWILSLHERHFCIFAFFQFCTLCILWHTTHQHALETLDLSSPSLCTWNFSPAFCNVAHTSHGLHPDGGEHAPGPNPAGGLVVSSFQKSVSLFSDRGSYRQVLHCRCGCAHRYIWGMHRCANWKVGKHSEHCMVAQVVLNSQRHPRCVCTGFGHVLAKVHESREGSELSFACDKCGLSM